MDLDLRVPVGLLFVTIGLIMGIFGLVSDPALYHKSLGINVNLYWGIVELIFGSLMVAFGLSRRKLAAVATPALEPDALDEDEAVASRTVIPPPVEPPVQHV